MQTRGAGQAIRFENLLFAKSHYSFSALARVDTLAPPPEENLVPTSSLTLEALLQDPNVAGSQYLYLQPEQPAAFMNAQQKWEAAGPKLTAADVERIVGAVIPENKKPAFAGEGLHLQLIVAGQNFDIKIVREAAGIKAQFHKIAHGTPAPAPPPGASSKRLEIEKFFRIQLDNDASDIHLSTDVPPMMRKDGEMKPLPGFDGPVAAKDMDRILFQLMPEKNREEFVRRNDTDFAYELGTEARFRCNIFRDRKGMGAVFRVIPSKILTAEAMGLSRDILKLCHLTKGLVLVTGPTGSGKSTTLCGMVDYVNRNRTDHIITIEDPVEFVHENKKCLINQREVRSHTDSFKDALRAALREDPDIILVGEMRDLETIAIAIEMAETGHLVFGTLHTSSAVGTVDRIVDQFPADRQSQIRVMLSESLKGVISQVLCKKIGGGRVPALEVLLVDHAIANLIREGKTTQMPSAMQTGKAKGNVMMNDALIELVKAKKVDPQEAYNKATDKGGFENFLKREKFDTAFISPEKPAAAAVGGVAASAPK
jgi:twitching motility protein PilT